MKAKISICIPTFNRAHTIGATVESVLKQNFKDFELLVLIDGSNDNTEEILNNIKDDRLKTYRNKHNLGYIPSMHKLTRLSKTNWIQFLSDDDILDNRYLEYCYKVIERRPDIGFVVTGTDFINDEGKYIYKMKKKYIDRHDYVGGIAATIIFPPKEMLGNFTMMSIPMLGGKYTEVLPTAFPGHIFNKSVLRKVGESDVQLFYNHDTLQVCKICVVAPCAYIDLPLLKYRIHDNLSKQAGESVEFVRQYFLFIKKFLVFLQNEKIDIPDIKEKLLIAFEKNFFSWNGHLLRIASKTNNYIKKNKNISNNLKIVFREIPSSRFKINTLIITGAAFVLPAELIENLGLLYFKYLRK